jgi:dipeptidyl aminopeptidase/acylaminoacyl peptidase
MGTVVLYHGWASNIQNYMFFASLISDWGYKVLVPELPYHGERGKLNYFDISVLQHFFWMVVIQALKEAEAVVSELSTTDEHIGIVGHSTGGFIAAGAFSKISRVQSAIVMNGSCAWVKCEELFREKDGRNAMSANERISLEKYDPVTHLNMNGKRALLLLHGKADNTIPIESQRYFMNQMSPHNISPEYVQLVEYSEVNHQVTIGMLQKSKEWLDKHLGIKGPK